MRRNFACLLFLAVLLCGCVKETTWVLHNTPGCPVSTSSPDLDRERTYLATLLALQSRGYAILRTKAPSYIEATHTSGNSPQVARVRWLIGIGPDASLTVDVPESERSMHPRVAGWYDTLLNSVRQLQCRDTNWLRWEAQNRGLVPIGAFVGSDAAGPPSSGGESAPPSTRTPNVHVHPSAERLAELTAERSQIHFVRPLVWAGIGAGVIGAGLVYTIYGAAFMAAGCTSDFDGEDCSLRDSGKVLLPIGLSLAAVGGAMLAIGLPRGLSRMRRFRELGREIKLLRGASLSLDAPSGQSRRGGWGLSFRAEF